MLLEVVSKPNEKRIIESRVQFLDFARIDIVGEQFRCNVLVKSKWKEMGQIENYDPEKHWNPKLYIENGLKRPGWIEKIWYTTEVFEDYTEITEHKDVIGDFWERMELHRFPFDSQMLSITLCSKHGSAVQIIHDEKKISTIHPRAFFIFHEQQKYELQNIVRNSAEASYEKNSRHKNLTNFESGNCLSTSVVITRRANFFVVNNFSIVLIINLLALTVFATEPKNVSSRLSPLFTLLLTCFAYKIVTNSQLPTISYLTILDKSVILSISYLFLLGVWFAILYILDVSEERRREIDGISFIAFSVLLLIFIGLVITYMMKPLRIVKRIKREEKKYSMMLKSITAYDISKYDY